MKTQSTVTRSIRSSFLAASILALASASHAATVTWGAATGITGDSDVSTAGTLVGAFDIGATGVGNTNVNGTTFTALTVTGTSVTSGNFNLTGPGLLGLNNLTSANAPFNNLSASYQALLSTIGATGGSPFTLTMSGLVTGQTYQFQWWYNDSAITSTFNTTASAGNSVTLQSNPSLVGGGLGQFATGTFVADGTNTQVITFTTTNNGGINGFQLRSLSAASAVPEPGSALAGMLALGACVSVLVKRNRTAKG